MNPIVVDVGKPGITSLSTRKKLLNLRFIFMKLTITPEKIYCRTVTDWAKYLSLFMLANKNGLDQKWLDDSFKASMKTRLLDLFNNPILKKLLARYKFHCQVYKKVYTSPTLFVLSFCWSKFYPNSIFAFPFLSVWLEDLDLDKQKVCFGQVFRLYIYLFAKRKSGKTVQTRALSLL